MQKKAYKMKDFLFKTVIGGFVKGAICAILGFLIQKAINNEDIFNLSWKDLVVTVVAAVGPVVINYLNPSDSRYGVNADKNKI